MGWGVDDDFDPRKASYDELRDVFGEHVPGTGRQINLPVVQPTPQQVATFSQTRIKTCGDCKYFNHREGQKRLWKDKFAATVVHDYEWKLEHLGGDPATLGICDQRDTMLTGPTVTACEFYKVK